VPAALAELRRRGWRLGILSNTDLDLLDPSIARLGVEIDVRVVASQIGSYKPGHRHWEELRRVATPSAHVHVAASVCHDLEPCSRLGIPAVWINRTGQQASVERAAELESLEPLPATLDRIAHGSGHGAA
jgi:FMN phosphatase YigB (HAD superfamily)